MQIWRTAPNTCGSPGQNGNREETVAKWATARHLQTVKASPKESAEWGQHGVINTFTPTSEVEREAIGKKT